MKKRALLFMLCLVLTWMNLGCKDTSFNQWQDISPFPPAETPYTFNLLNGFPYYVSGMFGIEVSRYNGNTWRKVGNSGFALGAVRDLQIASENEELYMAYYDDYVGKGIVVTYSGNSWERVGKTGYFSNGAVTNISLIVKNKVLYISYKDAIDTQYKVALMNSDLLTISDNLPLSDLESKEQAILVKNSSNIYLFVKGNYNYDYDTKSKIKLLRLDSAAWVEAGSFDPGTYLDSFSVACENNYFYLAYSTGVEINVTRFDGQVWFDLPKPGIQYRQIQMPVGGIYGNPPFASITVQNGEPSLLYRDYEHNLKVSVKRFKGSNWSYVGGPGFSKKMIITGQIIQDSNTIYICFLEPWLDSFWDPGDVRIMKYRILEY